MCQTAIVYGRTLGERVLEFGHEGVLYRNSFMMYDRQTGSLWLHVTGQALKGELRGAQLGFLPAEVVRWADWRLRHPSTTVLLGDKAEGFMGSFGLRERFGSYGLSVGQGRQVSLFDFELLEQVPVLNDRGGERPLVVVYDPERMVGAAFSAAVERDGRAAGLHFETVIDPDAARPLMRDAETGSLWDRMGGRCVAGALQGTRLARVAAVPWLSERWIGFFPEGRRVALPEVGGGREFGGQAED